MQLDSYYKQMASLIIDMIPEEWSEAVIYAEENSEGAQTYFFYYQHPETREWKYYMQIPETSQILKEDFDKLCDDLYFSILDFRDTYQEESGDPWASFQMKLQRNGRFNINFNHVKNPLDPMLTEVAWAYEQLGLEPKEGSFDRTLLNEYLEEKAQGKRYPFLEPKMGQQ